MDSILSLSNTGGFPFTSDKTVDFIQTNYTRLQELAKAVCGSNPAILYGCIVAGSNVSAGVMIIDGEVLPFESQALGTHITVLETVINKNFNDGVSRPAYKIRKAVFSVSGTPWADFWRVSSLKDAIVPTQLNDIAVFNGSQYVWPGTILQGLTNHASMTDVAPSLCLKRIGNMVFLDGTIQYSVATSTNHSNLAPSNDDYLGWFELNLLPAFRPRESTVIAQGTIWQNNAGNQNLNIRNLVKVANGFRLDGLGGYGAWSNPYTVKVYFSVAYPIN